VRSEHDLDDLTIFLSVNLIPVYLEFSDLRAPKLKMPTVSITWRIRSVCSLIVNSKAFLDIRRFSNVKAVSILIRIDVDAL